MEFLGTDFNNSGSVMSRVNLEELRKKRGECVSCGRKCFKKKLFRMEPIDECGRVLNGRCLNCHPIDGKDGRIPAVSRPATADDLSRFNRSKQQLSSRNLMASSGVSTSALSTDSAGMPRRPFPTRVMSENPTRNDSRGGSIGSSSSNSSRAIAPRSHSMLPTPAPATPHTPSRTLSGVISESQPLVAPPRPSTRAASVNAGTSNGSSYSQEDHLLLPPSSSQFSSQRTGSSVSRQSLGSNLPNGVSHLPTDAKPTPEEMQQAAMTLLAAKKHGVLPAGSDPDLDEQIDQLNESYRRDQLNESYRRDHLDQSNRSMSSSHASGRQTEIDGYAIPQHGILDRGGAFPVIPPMSNRPHLVMGSNRTLSSMSSIEEDSAKGRITSRKDSHVVAVCEGREDCNFSLVSSNNSRQSSGRSNSDGPLLEQSYIDEIRRVGHNFGEVLIILREAMAYPIVVREALEKLARLELTVEVYDILADMAAPKVISDAILTHKSVMQVQLWGCGAIWKMSGTERNQLAFVDAGALDGILAAMDRFIDDVDVQEKAIATLSNLAAAEDNLELLVDKGAVGQIVKAMNKHSQAESVQIMGCAAVANLASHDSPFKKQIMELGGGGAVVIAMVMHPGDFCLQEKALRALRNLCANSEENKVELANIGGIDAAISAMQVHRDEAGVQEEGAWTLSNLAENDDSKAAIGDCGGIDVIIRAMWVHSDNVGVQEWCIRALFTLTLDLSNGDIVLEVGGISAVVNAMQAHVDSPVVQEMGCAVLGNLAGTVHSKMRIVDEEALDAIVLAMVLHTDDMQVQERACMVLLRLAIPENAQSMQAATIPELAMTAARKFPERCEGPANRLVGNLS